MNIKNEQVINRLKPVAQEVGRHSIDLMKRIVPGVIMMTCSFTIGHKLNSGNKVNAIPASKDAAWAYQAGQQRIRDSLKIVELEQKLAADSMKIYHLTKKVHIK